MSEKNNNYVTGMLELGLGVLLVVVLIVHLARLGHISIWMVPLWPVDFISFIVLSTEGWDIEQ